MTHNSERKTDIRFNCKLILTMIRFNRDLSENLGILNLINFIQ